MPDDPIQQLAGAHFQDSGNFQNRGQSRFAAAALKQADLRPVNRSVIEMLLDQDTWNGLSPATKSTITKAGLKSLIEKVDEAVNARTFDARPDRHLAVVTLRMDEQGWAEIAEAMDELLAQFYTVADEASARVGDSDNGFPVTLSQLLYESPSAAISD